MVEKENNQKQNITPPLAIVISSLVLICLVNLLRIFIVLRSTNMLTTDIGLPLIICFFLLIAVGTMSLWYSQESKNNTKEQKENVE